jgi:hypothetical protein
MKRIVIFQDSEVNGKKYRNTLRAIAPSDQWLGFSKSGTVIDSEAKKLAKFLEPNSTGYYIA